MINSTKYSVLRQENKMQKRFFNFFFLLFTLMALPSCGVYSFNDVGSVEEGVKTIKVNFIENRASYVNPRISPTLTESLRQKIIRQSKLSNTNSDDAHYIITATITEYNVSTSGVSSSTTGNGVALSRLTVGLQITRLNQLTGKTEQFAVSRPFDYSSTLTLQAAESQLLDEMIRTLTDEIFNRIFSNW